MHFTHKIKCKAGLSGKKTLRESITWYKITKLKRRKQKTVYSSPSSFTILELHFQDCSYDAHK